MREVITSTFAASQGSITSSNRVIIGLTVGIAAKPEDPEALSTHVNYFVGLKTPSNSEIGLFWLSKLDAE